MVSSVLTPLRNRIALPILGLAALLLAFPATAQDGSASAQASAQGSATASVVAPLTLIAQTPLDFGTIAVTVGGAAGGAGTVTVSPAGGAARYAGSVRALCGAMDTCLPQPARFQVRGEAGRDYRIQLPAAAEAYGDRPGSPVLAVDGLSAASASLPASLGGGRLDDAGHDGFRVGGTLHVPSGTPVDRYTAEVVIVVSYI